MSKVKFLGFKETQGTFEGKPYHSIKLHISEPFTSENAYGSETSVQSVKYDRMAFVFGRPMELSELATYVNSEADFQYDKNGAVVSIRFDADIYEPVNEPSKK